LCFFSIKNIMLFIYSRQKIDKTVFFAGEWFFFSGEIIWASRIGRLYYFCFAILLLLFVKEYRIYNRSTGVAECEISGNTGGLAFLYRSLPGKVLVPLINRHFVSKFYARFVKSRRSKKLIGRFIKQYHVNQDDVKFPVDYFQSLNDFFIRELKSTARPIDPEPRHFISPADSRLFVYDLSKHNAIPVKGYWYSLNQFIQNEELALEFSSGWCFVFRLAPCDYHRFCYADDGKQDDVNTIKGALHSVNPIALSAVKSLMAKNYRELTVLHTDHFGKILHFEVGALMVGKVILHNRKFCTFSKGQEKGWFEFGGSTIVQFIHKEAVLPDQDILDHTEKGLETLVKMGERIGTAYLS
jgi:phosphatidylserine decarboxylase